MRLIHPLESAPDTVLADVSDRLERALRSHNAGCPAPWAEKIRDCLADLEMVLAGNQITPTRAEGRSWKDDASSPAQDLLTSPRVPEIGLVVLQAKLVREEAERVVKKPPPDWARDAKLLEQKRIVSQCAWIRLRGRRLLAALHALQRQ